ncbi:MAG: hypothetical protein M1335_05440 [Chloroflexi bacterium]|nr:hypothetical protein [Chloroflexota bacterium]
MNFVFAVGMLNLALALSAGLIAVGIFRRVSGRLATSWRYLLAAFLVLAFAEVLGAVSGALKGSPLTYQIVSLLFQAGHFAFIILAFTGLWYQYRLLKRLTGEDDT